MFQIACFSIPPKNKVERKYFWAYANLTAASFKFHSPDIRTILLTTKRAKIPKGLEFAKIKRLPEKIRLKKGLMVDELQGWIDFVQSDLFDRPTLLVDPDLILQRDLTGAIEWDFDIGLTWRDTNDLPEPTKIDEITNRQPINAGVIFLNPDRKEIVAQYFERCLEYLLTIDPDFWKWYGDQECLLRVAGLKGKSGYTDQVQYVDGVRVRLFRCDEYNFSPPALADGTPVYSHHPDPYIVHFKGLRKQIMFQYAEQFAGMRMQHDEKSPGGVKFLLNR